MGLTQPYSTFEGQSLRIPHVFHIIDISWCHDGLTWPARYALCLTQGVCASVGEGLGQTSPTPRQEKLSGAPRPANVAHNLEPHTHTSTSTKIAAGSCGERDGMMLVSSLDHYYTVHIIICRVCCVGSTISIHPRPPRDCAAIPRLALFLQSKKSPASVSTAFLHRQPLPGTSFVVSAPISLSFSISCSSVSSVAFRLHCPAFSLFLRHRHRPLLSPSSPAILISNRLRWRSARNPWCFTTI